MPAALVTSGLPTAVSLAATLLQAVGHLTEPSGSTKSAPDKGKSHDSTNNGQPNPFAAYLASLLGSGAHALPGNPMPNAPHPVTVANSVHPPTAGQPPHPSSPVAAAPISKMTAAVRPAPLLASRLTPAVRPQVAEPAAKSVQPGETQPSRTAVTPLAAAAVKPEAPPAPAALTQTPSPATVEKPLAATPNEAVGAASRAAPAVGAASRAVPAIRLGKPDLPMAAAASAPAPLSPEPEQANSLPLLLDISGARALSGHDAGNVSHPAPATEEVPTQVRAASVSERLPTENRTASVSERLLAPLAENRAASVSERLSAPLADTHSAAAHNESNDRGQQQPAAPPAPQPSAAVIVTAAATAPAPPAPVAVPVAVGAARQAAPTPVVDQLSRAFVSQAGVVNSNGRVDFHLRLEPPSLGTVQIHLTATDHRVSAHVIVAQEHTRVLLQNQANDLRQSLAQAGLSLGGFDVTRDNSDSGDGGRSGLPSRTPSAARRAATVKERASAGLPSRTTSAGGIDLLA